MLQNHFIFMWSLALFVSSLWCHSDVHITMVLWLKSTKNILHILEMLWSTWVVFLLSHCLLKWETKVTGQANMVIYHCSSFVCWTLDCSHIKLWASKQFYLTFPICFVIWGLSEPLHSETGNKIGLFQGYFQKRLPHEEFSQSVDWIALSILL